MYINNIQVCGNLVADPALDYYHGSPFTKFVLALNPPKKEKTYYIECIAWQGRASTIHQYCQKGQELFVSGEIETRTWTDKNGMNHKSTTLVVEKFSLGKLPRKREVEVRRPAPPLTAERSEY